VEAAEPFDRELEVSFLALSAGEYRLQAGNLGAKMGGRRDVPRFQDGQNSGLNLLCGWSRRVVAP